MALPMLLSCYLSSNKRSFGFRSEVARSHLPLNEGEIAPQAGKQICCNYLSAAAAGAAATGASINDVHKNFGVFLPSPPLSAFGTDSYYKIDAAFLKDLVNARTKLSRCRSILSRFHQTFGRVSIRGEF